MYGPQVHESWSFFLVLGHTHLLLLTTTAAADLLSRFTTADVVDAEKQTCGLVFISKIYLRV